MPDSVQRSLTATLLCLLGSCAVGPDYVRPSVETPPAFKEAAGWKVAQPQDQLPRGKWWKIFDQAESASEGKCYRDAQLDALEMQIDISNQNIKQAEAKFRQEQDIVSQARAAYFPGVSASYSDTRTNSTPSFFSAINMPGPINNEYNAGLSASWELDVWGKIRRTVESKKAGAEASEANLEAARLSTQAELATDYINLRFADEVKRLLDDTVAYDEKTLQLTRSLYASGIARRSDVIQAEQQLESARTQAIDAGVQRAQLEHAIAILIGKAPAFFSIAPAAYVPLVPHIPPGLPSDLLERRPDIAAAERAAAAANAQIGVAEAAFFPTIGLSASGSYESTAFEHFSQLFSMPNRIWSIGPSVSETLFDAGLHSAQKREAIAAYDQAVAGYRQTVLGGFKEVEDNLSGMRLLEEEATAQQKSAADAHEAVKLLLSQYKAGIARYSEVLAAQNAATKSELAALNTDNKRLTTAVALVKALGGGWDGKVVKAGE
jgi:NodT family efflux transporter outer membrane factor (OMF) lipoprotein